MRSRRKFLRQAFWLPCLIPFGKSLGQSPLSGASPPDLSAGPSSEVIISTWDLGFRANERAAEVLGGGGSTLDAVEQGVKLIEADPKVTTVGYGATPDRTGKVTLDACIMDHQMNCGAVCFLEDIMHPVSVARKVMEDSPHVMLAGEGAYDFAREQGFPKTKLLTPNARENWKNWKKEHKYEPIINIENHDTIGMLGIDKNGILAGACTTSGIGFKMRGRVGDSPIIGAGLYVDGEIGGAVATGLGELVLKTLTTFLVVEFMRMGLSPQEACEKALQRIIDKTDTDNAQVGVLALRRDGQTGASSIRKGFSYAEYRQGENVQRDGSYLLTK